MSELEQRLAWIVKRLEEAKENGPRLLRPGLEQTDFNGFIDGLEWIASGEAGQQFDDYPSLDFGDGS